MYYEKNSTIGIPSFLMKNSGKYPYVQEVPDGDPTPPEIVASPVFEISQNTGQVV